MKWFLERKVDDKHTSGAKAPRIPAEKMYGLKPVPFTGKIEATAHVKGFKIAFGAIAFAAAALAASASILVWQSPGLLLGAGNGLSRWMENAEAG